MSVRSVVSLLSLVGMVYAGSLAMSSPRAQALEQCCDSSEECSAGICCDAGSVEKPACNDERSGYCMTSCRPDGVGNR